MDLRFQERSSDERNNGFRKDHLARETTIPGKDDSVIAIVDSSNHSEKLIQDRKNYETSKME